MVGDSQHVTSGLSVDRQQRGTLPNTPAINVMCCLRLPDTFSSRLLILGAYLMGQDLYKYLIVYLNEYLKTLRKVLYHQLGLNVNEIRKHSSIKTKIF
jgi:hypothetical protein